MPRSSSADADGEARAIAGGTDLLGRIKERVHACAPETLVDLKRIPGLEGLEEAGRLADRQPLAPEGPRRDPLVSERIGRWPRRLTRSAPRSFATWAPWAATSPRSRAAGTTAPPRTFLLRSQGWAGCNAFTGDSRYHSISGSMKVAMRPCTAGVLARWRSRSTWSCSASATSMGRRAVFWGKQLPG